MIIMKSQGINDHLLNLREVLERTRKHGAKMNPYKCAYIGWPVPWFSHVSKGY
jgi:hypothetical protein